MLFGIDQRHGGGVCMWYSSPTIHSCWITENSAHAGPALFGEGCGARVSHFRIFHNCSVFHPDFGAGGGDYFNLPLSVSDTLVYEWNEVYENFSCDSAYTVIGGGLSAYSWPSLYGVVLVQFNHFHDYECTSNGGVVASGVQLLACGNVFERISMISDAILIFNASAHRPASLTDNLIRNITIHGDGMSECVSISGDGADGVLIDRNWFESDSNAAHGPSVLWINDPHGYFRENMVVNCRGSGGAVQFSLVNGCDVLLERNCFLGNRASGLWYHGSALTVYGDGLGCDFYNNWFEGNEGIAVGTVPGLGSVTLDVSGNYWGDPSGPYDSLNNPNGQGDTLGYNTFATWWLTDPPELSVDWRERLRLHPEDWTLEQAFPNPFNAITNLRLTSSKPQPFEVQAYDILGRRVARVWQGVIQKDQPTLIRWNTAADQGRSIASGVYFLVAVPKGPGAGAPKSAKVVLLK